MASTQGNGALKDQMKTGSEVAKIKPADRLAGLVNKMQAEIAKSLPKHLKENAERYARIAVTLVRQNPKLASCDPVSFLGAMMTSSALGLDPSPVLGQCYIIPYKNEAQFQLGYKGMIDLAMRSDRIATIFATEVYEQDEFDYSLGLEQKLIHKPCGLEDPGEVTHFYAVAKYVNGGFVFGVLSKAQVEAHAKKYSQSYNYNSSPWQTNFNEMGKKTVLKKIWKFLPISVEVQKASIRDESITRDISHIKDESDIIDVPVEFVNAEPIEEKAS